MYNELTELVKEKKKFENDYKKHKNRAAREQQRTSTDTSLVAALRNNTYSGVANVERNHHQQLGMLESEISSKRLEIKSFEKKLVDSGVISIEDLQGIKVDFLRKLHNREWESKIDRESITPAM